MKNNFKICNSTILNNYIIADFIYKYIKSAIMKYFVTLF